MHLLYEACAGSKDTSHVGR